MSFTEEDWVNDEATSHRQLDERNSRARWRAEFWSGPSGHLCLPNAWFWPPPMFCGAQPRLEESGRQLHAREERFRAQRIVPP